MFPYFYCFYEYLYFRACYIVYSSIQLCFWGHFSYKQLANWVMNLEDFVYMLSIFTIFDIQIRQQYLCFVLSVMYIHAHIEIQIHTRFFAICFAIKKCYGLHKTISWWNWKSSVKFPRILIYFLKFSWFFLRKTRFFKHHFLPLIDIRLWTSSLAASLGMVNVSEDNGS